MKREKTISSLPKKLFSLLFFRTRRWIYRGSFKDPFLYFGVLSVIFFGFFSFTSHHLLLNLNPNFETLTASLVNLDNQLERGGKIFLGPELGAAKEFSDLILVQENSIMASVPPVMVTPQILSQIVDESEAETRKEIIEYTIQTGDTLSSIAENFGISFNTLLWANDLNKSSVIKLGQRLIILPVSGVIHHVRKGDTISEVAKIYKADPKDIIAFNELSLEGEIFIGDILIIPDGVMPPPSQAPAPTLVPLASSYFIYPLSSFRLTQGLHWYNAVDFGTNCGSPVYAVAGGMVLRTKYGWNGGAGNYLTILHPNGVVTFYGHLLNILVNSGDQVYQGQIIVLVGGQPGTSGAGKSTGCHLHFGVQGAKNPFAP